MGRWLDRLANRPVDVTVRHDQAGRAVTNQPSAESAEGQVGLDLSAWMAIVFVCVTVFLVGFRVVALIAFPSLAIGAWLVVRKHPKMFELWGLSLSQRSYYDPRKH